MQTTTNATLFQTSYSEALGAYRSRKAIFTSGLVSPSPSSSARYGYPVHLHPNFEQAVITNAADLAVEGSGADGGRYRVLSLRVADGWLWTSEAGGIVRQVCPETGRTVAVYKEAKAPVPSFDFITGKEGEKLLVTGSWDRAIRVYRVPNPDQKVSSVNPVMEVAAAMTDFIKCIHVFTSDGRTYIATAGSDKSVMIWDASPLLSPIVEGALKCVHQSKNHTRPINALASLTGLDGTTRVYSADSMGRILESTLNPSSLRLEVVREVQGFSTSVYDLKVGWRREEVEGDPPGTGGDAFVSEVKEDTDGSRYRLVAELWGASGDKSAAGYRLSPTLQPASSVKTGAHSTSTQPPLGRNPPLTTPHVKIQHDDFVKSVLPLSLHLPASPPFEQYSTAVVTGGSDEHLRLFPHPSSTTLTAARDDGEVYEVESHWHEITSLAVWLRTPTSAESVLPPIRGREEVWVVSASLDGSIRRWNVESIAKLPRPEMVRPTQHEREVQEWDQHSLPPIAANGNKGQDTVVGSKGGVQMTAEEEAELAELMDSDDE